MKTQLTIETQALIGKLRKSHKAKLRYWLNRVERGKIIRATPGHKIAIMIGYLQALKDIRGY